MDGYDLLKILNSLDAVDGILTCFWVKKED